MDPMFGALAGIIDIVRSLLGDWSPREIDYYFELAIKTHDFMLVVRTNDQIAGRTIAAGLADYMRQLRAEDLRRLHGDRTPHILGR